MLSLSCWIVAGDVLNASKPAHAVVKRLAQHHRTVFPLNPRLSDVDVQNARQSSPPDEFEQPVTNSLSSLQGQAVDVLDLCIHPALGLGLLPMAKSLGITNVFIQPGAESEEILAYCRDHNITVHQGCVLRELH